MADPIFMLLLKNKKYKWRMQCLKVKILVPMASDRVRSKNGDNKMLKPQ